MLKSTKTLVISVFSGIYMLLAFLFWTASSSTGDNRALELFKDKQYRYAHVYVEELEKSALDPRYSLYQAYILRSNQDLISSDNRLQQAIILAEQKGATPQLLIEVYLNQALNAYLMDDSAKMWAALTHAEKLQASDGGWIRLFSSIYEMKKNKSKREEFAEFDARSLKYLSPWMKESFSAQFNPDWFEMHQIRWLIDTGKFITARQKLEDFEVRAPQSLRDEITFMYGFSYFQEGQEKPLDRAAAYYKLSFSYFDRLKEKKQHRDWQMMALALQKQVRELANTENQENIPFYFGLLEQLSPWIDTHVLVPDFAIAIQDKTEEEAFELIRLIANSSFRTAMKNHMEEAAIVSLKQKKYDQAAFYGQLIEQLKYEKESNALVKAIEEELLRTVLIETESLDETATLLALWDELETDAKQRYFFAAQIVKESERIWASLGDHRKAIILMGLAKEMSADVHQLIETAVDNIYRSAVTCDQISQYFCVMDAVRALQLVKVDIFNRDETLHQLGDAEYYFGKRRIQEANERALWVLQIDPQNQIANRIAGLIAYAEGNREKVLFYLGKLQKTDALTQKALEAANLSE